MNEDAINRKFEEWFAAQEAGMKRAIPLMYYQGVKVFAKHAYVQGVLDILKVFEVKKEQ